MQIEEIIILVLSIIIISTIWYIFFKVYVFVKTTINELIYKYL